MKGIIKILEKRELLELKTKSLKRSARGYRNPKNFMIMIYLRLGKLEFNLPT
jgi:hypothetical protein